jgi:hypothetical protein
MIKLTLLILYFIMMKYARLFAVNFIMMKRWLDIEQQKNPGQISPTRANKLPFKRIIHPLTLDLKAKHTEQSVPLNNTLCSIKTKQPAIIANVVRNTLNSINEVAQTPN